MKKIGSKETKMSRLYFRSSQDKWMQVFWLILLVLLFAVIFIFMFFRETKRHPLVYTSEKLGLGCQIAMVGKVPRKLRRPIFDSDNTSDTFQKVTASWFYNPSIAHLGDKMLYAGRLTWQYNTDCNMMTTPRSLYYCNMASVQRTNDYSLFGTFQINECEVNLQPWNLHSNGTTETLFGNIKNWYGGSGWYDSKLIVPPDHIMTENHSALSNVLIITAQKSQILLIDNLIDLDIFEKDATILTQLMYITAVNTASKSSSSGPISFAVALYFDEGASDWTTPFCSTTIKDFMMSPSLLVRAQCKSRFEKKWGGFDAITNVSSVFSGEQAQFISKLQGGSNESEFMQGVNLRTGISSREAAMAASARRGHGDSRDIDTSGGVEERELRGNASLLAGSREGLRTGRRRKKRRGKSGDFSVLAIGESGGGLRRGALGGQTEAERQLRDRRERRRLAAIMGTGYIGAVKDKNWSPFFHRGRLLWSYMITPHIVCELERSLDELPTFFGQIESDDCILCLRRFATNNTLLFDAHAASQTSAEEAMTIPGEKSPMLWKYHLNGVPAFKLQGQPFFLGVCHAISETWQRMEAMVKYTRMRAYVHYFYKMEAQPPFRILALSRPMPLQHQHAVSSWFELNEVADVAFVSGFDYMPEHRGQELLLSYGVGDLFARVTRISVETALALFDDEQDS